MTSLRVISSEYIDAISALDVRGYTVEGVLGRGGIGVVFAATYESKPVAVKVAWPHTGEHDGALGEKTVHRLRAPKLSEEGLGPRFIPPTELGRCNRVLLGEVSRIREAEHPSVITVTSQFAVDARQAYVMPRLRGRVLDPTSTKDVARLAEEIHQLHDLHWPHGDLKPENVLFDDEGKVTLIDPLPVGLDLVTPDWTHLNFLVSSPLVESADPRDRRMYLRHRDLVALALMGAQAVTGERPWGHAEVIRMADRSVGIEAKREVLRLARARLDALLPKLPAAMRPFVGLALDPGLWPDDGPIFAAYLQARPFEVRCDALTSMNLARIFREVAG
ncbi:MAG: lipopolysaccharide kinase InaA family protein [Deltaproteobacteria bacterium]|nr:lipopolysaccharide kinase InaA family protein [Myxococcales bacterium]MDP3217661.1 lipopolysaccharide kinase InaA family protein [Deltaproteobacteria bacterium]